MAEFNKLQKPVYVTSPILPDLQDYIKKLELIWQSKWLTNHGCMHQEFENKLQKILNVGNVSVFNNGTIALMVSLKALNLPFGSEVITTPFTFPATPHSITWNGLKPVFCDIDRETMNLDPEKIESAITSKTAAILPVHVYGIPCDVVGIQATADKYNLKVIYDAAHAFTTEIDGRAIGNFGNISMFSFHATKLFHAIEGGCLTYNNPDYKEKIYYLRNFGIKNEEEVNEIGINGKMNEFQSAMGLLNLELFEEEKSKRSLLSSVYSEGLKTIEGIKIVQMPANATNSMQYFVIRIDKDIYGLSRDDLYNRLREGNVYARKYFYPLCSDYEPYNKLPSSVETNLPIANRIKNEVLCLPFYGSLKETDARKICDIIKSARRKKIIAVSGSHKSRSNIVYSDKD